MSPEEYEKRLAPQTGATRSSTIPEKALQWFPETGGLFPKVPDPQTPPTAELLEKSPHQVPNASEKRSVGPYTPTLILHGGSGSITRSKLPPALYKQYRASLLQYLDSTHEKLKAGTSALDAACHAVTLMEDDPLFNCGRGSVFTEKGTIEMEASVMVASVRCDGGGDEIVCSRAGASSVPTKRGASVSLVKETRHPILLAREVLLAGGDGLGGVGTMHCQLSGRDVEEWGWEERGLERKAPDWFWTRKRWREHLRGLQRLATNSDGNLHEKKTTNLDGGYGEKWVERLLYPDSPAGVLEDVDDLDNPSQGTVGTVCMDSWGNLAVATSTGGLTNKREGRIGDTPTLGAGFWAESWAEDCDDRTEEKSDSSRHRVDGRRTTFLGRILRAIDAGFGDVLKDCVPTFSALADHPREILRSQNGRTEHLPLIEREQPTSLPKMALADPTQNESHRRRRPRRRAVAMSGTGNGDSFLRTSAVRTAAARCRFGSQPSKSVTLAKAITAVAGPGGDIQKSAGNRWEKTFEGQGGIIGIELYGDEKRGKVAFDFNCGGLWRAWIDEETGQPHVMVFKGEYEE